MPDTDAKRGVVESVQPESVAAAAREVAPQVEATVLDDVPLHVREEEEFRRFAESPHHLVWTMDEAFRLTYVGPSSRTLFGTSPEEVIARGWRGTLTTSLIKHCQRIFAERVRERKQGLPVADDIPPFELEHKRPDGTTVWVEVRMRRRSDGRGVPKGFVGFSRDITHQKAAAAALESREASLRQAMALARMGTWRAWPDGRVEWSDEVCRLFGYEPDQVPTQGDFFLRHVFPDDVERLKVLIETPSSTGHPIAASIATTTPKEHYATVEGWPNVSEMGTAR